MPPTNCPPLPKRTIELVSKACQVRNFVGLAFHDVAWFVVLFAKMGVPGNRILIYRNIT